MKQIYLILAAMLLLCLAPMPYGYFMLVRFVMMVAFGWMAYRYYKMNKETAAIWFGVLALLFQPIYKIALGRVIWNIVDVIVALFLIALFILEWRQGNKNKVSFNPLPPKEPDKRLDNSIEFKIEGRLGTNELIYVANGEDKELEQLFESKPEIFDGWGKMIGFQIIYLPLLMKQLADRKVLQYRAPYLSEQELEHARVGNDYLLQYLAHAGDKDKIQQGFIRTDNVHKGDDGKDKAINRFYPLSSHDKESIADQLHRIGKQIHEERLASGRLLDSDSTKDKRSDTGYGDAEDGFNSQVAQENIDDLLEEVRERIVKLRQRGISQQILEALVHPDDRLSRLVITKDFSILLPDYNQMEIKMEPLVKAVFLLFLNHPEGIMFKCLPEYRQELTELYQKVRPAGLSDRSLQSIEDVTNPLLNSINEKCARIRGAFLAQFDDHMARHYYVDGLRGEAKRISLPRDLVVWE